MMTAQFKTSHYASLVREQAEVQCGKQRDRLLNEYDALIVTGQQWERPPQDNVAAFLRPLCLTTRVSLEGILDGLHSTKGMPVNWVDMGAGHALPMRQLACNPEMRARVSRTAVDLFLLKPEDMERPNANYVEQKYPGILDGRNCPSFLCADVETVVLPQPADVITSIESVQYLNNPLAVISNWYNQLADNGLVIVATNHKWSQWLAYGGGAGEESTCEAPAQHLTDALQSANIPFAANPGHLFGVATYSCMAIQKKPGTQLQLRARVTEVRKSDKGYKRVFYEQVKGGLSPIEVVAPERAFLGLLYRPMV